MDGDKLTKLQIYLNDKQIEYYSKGNSRTFSDNKWAKHLGISPATYNAWINGLRPPNFKNAYQVASVLGPEILEILGYDVINAQELANPRLKFLAKNFHRLKEDTQQEMVKAMEEEIGEKFTIPK